MAGVGGAVGGMVGGMMNDAVNNAVQGPSNDIIQCKNCGNAMKKGTKILP